MRNHFKLSDTEFELQFASGTLDPMVFTHDAHLRLAWIHLKKYGLESAKQNICSQLRQFVEIVGEKGKYHETLTIAAVEIVNYFLSKAPDSDFRHFLREFPELKTDFNKLVESHYSCDLLKSDMARNSFVKPDNLPFG